MQPQSIPPAVRPTIQVRRRSIMGLIGSDEEKGDSPLPKLELPSQRLAWESSFGERSNSVGLDKANKKGKIDPEPTKLGFRGRIKHFTWTWFTLTMATGGVASVLWHVPAEYQFDGIYSIGLVFMFLNMAIFIFNCVCMFLRFYWWPKTLRASYLHPTESLFAPAPIISISIILTNITQYGLSQGRTGVWLTSTMAVFYWIYLGLAVAFSCGIYLVMWSTQTFTLSQMTPVWIFPAYPLLTAGPFASVLSHPATGRGGASAIRICISGTMVQGIGFMVSLMVYSAFLYRLMTQKLPAEPIRPGMFISVGPSAFTITALIGMGANFAAVVPNYAPDFMGNGYLAGMVTKIIANWAGIWLWGLAAWFFLISLGAHFTCVSHGSLHFAMTWNSFIFPNTAFIMATFSVGSALENQQFKILGCVMTVALVLGWLTIIIMTIRAVILKQILWPQKQEDRDVDHREQQMKREGIARSNPPFMTPFAEHPEPDWVITDGVTHSRHASLQ